MAKTPPLTQIPAALLDAPQVGYNLPAATLGTLVAGEPTLLVFLRHFGCIFCKEMVADLRAASADNPDYPPILFVNHGEFDFAEPFFAAVWPEARCIVDCERTLYAAFGVERMGKLAALNPQIIACGVRAAGKGHMQTAAKGDPQQMPGLFLVHGAQVLWQHDFKHAGDHPDWRSLPERLPTAAGAIAAG